MSVVSGFRIPKYRENKSRKRGFVEWKRKRHYLPGAYQSPESWAAYKRFIVQVVSAAPPADPPTSTGLTLAGLIKAFLDHAAKRYGRGARGEYANCLHALRPLGLGKHGPVLAAEFGPKKLKEWREELMASNSRSYINKRVNKLRRAFKWAVSEELIPVATYQALITVPGLQAGECEAKETAERKPVDWKYVEPVLERLSPLVADMVRVQWLTAVRSGSLVRAKPEQFDLKAERGLWLWRPRHKTEKRGKQLVVPVGPQCQRILKTYLEQCPPGGYLFRPRTQRKNRRYGERYTTSSYYRAVARAIVRLNKTLEHAGQPAIDEWFPHQLRHSKGQAVNEEFGLEGAQAHLGHDTVDATKIYTSRRLKLAKRIARKTG